jgi:hypothetical protein
MFIRAVFEYIAEKARQAKATENPLVKAAICIGRIVLKCVECCIK